jgi:NADH-quinone oxidoreductase subunit F
MTPAVEFRIGLGSCGVASGGEPVRTALEQAADGRATVKTVGCNGMCHCEPMVEVVEPGGRSTLYGNVNADGAQRIVRKHLRPAWLPAWWHKAPPCASERRLGPAVEAGPATSYLGKQKRIVLENCGEIDPLNIDDYLARAGYEALARCRELAPEDVIGTIVNSGLRGRGGAGFPTGTKWKLALANADPVKYVICNGDEGDPGAFMDRLVLESDPHRVLEGLAIAAHAVGATQGYLYIRAEYPLAVRHTRAAIVQATERGLLGALALEVREGAGAFVCGEETALIQSLEGKRGMPRLRPPYPVERWPACRGSCATAPKRSPGSALRPAAAPKSSRWPARSIAAA